MSEEPRMNMRKFDWHLFWAAAGVVVLVGSMIIGSYISLIKQIAGCKLDLSKEIHHVRSDLSKVNAEVIKIQTVLIIKGVAPKEIFSADSSHD